MWGSHLGSYCSRSVVVLETASWWFGWFGWRQLVFVRGLATWLSNKGSNQVKLYEAILGKIVKCSESMWKLTYYATVEACVLRMTFYEPWFRDPRNTLEARQTMRFNKSENSDEVEAANFDEVEAANFDEAEAAVTSTKQKQRRPPFPLSPLCFLGGHSRQ
ncbi:hypothetical protein Dimus_032176 [Dionaea muscipula]